MSDRKMIQLPNDQIAAVEASMSSLTAPGAVVFESTPIAGRPIVVRHALIRLTEATSKLVVHVQKINEKQREQIGGAVWAFCNRFLRDAGIRAESSQSLVERSTQDFVFYDLPTSTAGLTRSAVVEVIVKALG